MALSGTYSVHALSVLAAATLTASRFVTLQGAVPAANAGNVGVTRTGAVSGEYVTVDVNGTAEVEASAAITVGALIGTTNVGKAVTWSTGPVLGRALTAAAGDGSPVIVLLAPGA